MNLWNNAGLPVNRIQNFARLLLGLMLITAGTSHETFARKEFRAQVPEWLPLGKDLTVVLSGIAEIMLGMSIAFWVRRRVFCGWVAALFFVLIFPGNIAQLINHRNAFGLNNDTARSIRLLFQPVLIAWALWSTGAWAAKNLISYSK